MQKIKTGFTLIEALTALILISISMIFLMKCMIVSLHGVKNSNTRFTVNQILENKKNSLLGMKFSSPPLAAGERTERAGKTEIRIRITDISDGLKRISLEGSFGRYRTATDFFRSKLFREDKYE